MRRKRTRHGSNLYTLHSNGFWYVNDNYSILKKRKSFFEHSSCSFYPPVWLLATVCCKKFQLCTLAKTKANNSVIPAFVFLLFIQFLVSYVSHVLSAILLFCLFVARRLPDSCARKHKGDAFISRIHLLKSFTEIICQRGKWALRGDWTDFPTNKNESRLIEIVVTRLFRCTGSH